MDKFLWCTRLFKTRSLAQKSCISNQICVDDTPIKAAHEVREGLSFSVKTAGYWRTYKVLDIPKSRVGAKLVPSYLVETTSSEILDRIEEMQRINKQNRVAGVLGRPTKKQRRSLENFSNQFKE